MNAKKTDLMTTSAKFFLVYVVLVATMLLSACDDDDPKKENEEELITTLTVTLTPQGGAPITMTFKDLDGDGAGVPEYVYSTGGNAAVLSTSTIYSAAITLLNESVNPVENITEEIEEEADEHLFCFEKSGLGGLTIDYTDTEADYITGGSSKVVGLASSWSTDATTGSGTIKIYLRHQPGTKTGTCPGQGETDIEVTFNISIQ